VQQAFHQRASRLRAAACGFHHRLCDVERDDVRPRIAHRQFADGIAGAASRVEDRRRRQLHVVEALRQPGADLALQHRRRIVGRRGAGKSAPHGRWVDIPRIGRRIARFTHR